MRIHELRSELHNRQAIKQLSRHGAASELVSYHGFKPMDGAHGSYSSVLVHPGVDYIIKLFDANDIGYMRFLEIVTANRTNPHFPRLKGRPMQLSPKTIGIRMEKLNPMPTGEYEELEYMLHNMSKNANWEQELRSTDLNREFLDKWPDFARAVALLRSAKGGNIRFDWHDGNLMKRTDGTPVIIDPFA